MSWASRRRAQYAFGIVLFLVIVVGLPLAYLYISRPPTCFDGIQNQRETAVDRGGPCALLDERSLTPSSSLWSRSFRVRDGSYNAIALIQNPNTEAGVRAVQYRFGLYDERNIFVAERTGTAFLMPGAITPIFEGAIDTGNRVVTRTYFDLTSPVTWERLVDMSEVIEISNTSSEDLTTAPRVRADVKNTSVAPVKDIVLIAVLYDPAGNAFAVSQTALTELRAGEQREITFTWPNPLTIALGRIQVLPVVAPKAP